MWFTLYKKLVSPLLTSLFGGGCRYQPTCSVYFAQATRKYGWLKGSWLGIKRLGRCHPFSGRNAYDPVE